MQVRAVSSDGGETWLEYVFGICPADRRLGKDGSRCCACAVALSPSTPKVMGWTAISLLSPSSAKLVEWIFERSTRGEGIAVESLVVSCKTVLRRIDGSDSASR
jgi:hypothetical protein